MTLQPTPVVGLNDKSPSGSDVGFSDRADAIPCFFLSPSIRDWMRRCTQQQQWEQTAELTASFTASVLIELRRLRAKQLSNCVDSHRRVVRGMGVGCS